MIQLALREGWAQPGLELDIIAIPGRVQPEMRVTEGRIYPASNLKNMRSNVESVISDGLDLAAYQAVWLVGFGLSGPGMGMIADRSHSFTRACHGLAADGSLAGLHVPQVSRQVMTEILALDINRSGFLPLMRKLTKQAGPALRVVTRPRPSALLLTVAQAELQALYGDHVEAALESYFALHDEVVARLIGTSAPILWQDPSTLAGSFTAEAFTKHDDETHMNSAYGRLVLDQLAASMQA
jgi:hypothetical protein